MTFMVERLAELRRYLQHLKTLQPRTPSVDALEDDFSLHNDVLFSLLMVCQLVIDIAAELAAIRAERFETYTEAILSLGNDPRFPREMLRDLARLPGFRNVLVHDYVTLDKTRAIEALHDLAAVEQFAQIVADLEAR